MKSLKKLLRVEFIPVALILLFGCMAAALYLDHQQDILARYNMPAGVEYLDGKMVVVESRELERVVVTDIKSGERFIMSRGRYELRFVSKGTDGKMHGRKMNSEEEAIYRKYVVEDPFV